MTETNTTEQHAPDAWLAVMSQLDSLQGDITTEVESTIMDMRVSMDVLQWIIGDAILKAGTSKHNMESFRKISGVKDATLRSWMTTAKVWTPDIRWDLWHEYDSVLSWAMFKELNSIANNEDYGIDVAVNALKEAGNKAMTMAELKRHIALDIKQEEAKQAWEQISDTVATSWVNHERETLNFELGDELASLIEVGKTYRIKIYEVIGDDI